MFIAGTNDWSLHSTDSAFDMSSNLALVAGVQAASLIATERAMADAGVTRNDRVVFVGHSQGGAVAATLAESGRYDTAGLFTVGAPTGTLPVTGSYPSLTVEHIGRCCAPPGRSENPHKRLCGHHPQWFTTRRRNRRPRKRGLPPHCVENRYLSVEKAG